MAVTYSALVSQNGAILTFWLKLCTKINTTLSCIFESVIESEQTSYIPSQSSKRLFRKIQIFEFAYSALPLFHFLFRFTCKNHLCIALYIRKALKNRKRLVASRYSLRSARFAKFAYSALPLFYSLFRLSRRGIGLLRHWIFSFQYMIIHFVSFRKIQ